MATVEERYKTATAYVRRAVVLVESRGVAFATDPVTGIVEWYAGRAKTEVPRNELARIEDRWWGAKSEPQRETVARDAELLADRVQEALPGAPQDRDRTNLSKGETPVSTPATSYHEEVANQAIEVGSWIGDKAEAALDGAAAIGKLLLVGGGLLLGWQLVAFLRYRGDGSRRAAGSTERLLNANLERAARVRDAVSRRRPALQLRDTELQTWFERDRAHVELRDRRTGRTIVEWWDGEVAQAVEDGFLPSQWSDRVAHQAAFDYAAQHGLLAPPRDAGAKRALRYSLQLTKGEIEALSFLQGRYESAKAFVGALEPLDDSADRALSHEFDRSTGPYRFQIRSAAVRKALRATAGDGGDYGAIPNLRSAAVEWVLAEERRRAP